MDHFLFNTPRLLVGTKGDLRNNGKRISELNTNGQELITVEQVSQMEKKSNHQCTYTSNIGRRFSKENQYTIH
jgi:GTPase SAR1 family protein